jgi:subtilisin family serine protease
MKSASLLIAVLACAAAAVPARADDATPGALIVKLAPSERAEVRERAGVEPAGRVAGLPGVDVVVPSDGDAERALAELDDDPAVAWAERVRPRRAFADDALLPQQWGLGNAGDWVWNTWGLIGADIDADGAWDVTRGADVTVAVVDSGAATDHPDLAPQLTGNPGERGGGRETNRVDDDHNGLVDDWRGWDYVSRDNLPEDAYGHGTHVAGTAAAAAGGGDVVGVAPEADLLPLQVLDTDGWGTSADVAAAFAYAGELGVRVVNASLGSDEPSQAERDAIHGHPNTLYVVAAGNDGADAAGTFPCAYDEPNVLCVGASDARDRPATFSNWSPTAVDLFAPGLAIVSSYPQSLVPQDGPLGYETMHGTSMASPHVAGAAALVAAQHPTWTPARIREALMATTDVRSALVGRALTAGRLDAAAALGWEAPADELEPAPLPGPAYVPASAPQVAPTPVPTPAPTPAPPVEAPAPAPTAPAPTAPAPAPVAPAPTAPPAAAPAISELRYVGKPRALSFSVGSAGDVRLVAERRVGTRYKRVGSRIVHVAAGRQRISLRRSLAGARLRPGTWRVTLGAARLTFRVR